MSASLPLTEEDLSQFATALEETQKDLQALERRYGEVRQAFYESRQIQSQLTQGHLPTAEVGRLRRQLETLEATLENQLLTWNNLREPFWQTLRFVGAGLVTGWFLRGWLG